MIPAPKRDILQHPATAAEPPRLRRDQRRPPPAPIPAPEPHPRFLEALLERTWALEARVRQLEEAVLVARAEAELLLRRVARLETRPCTPHAAPDGPSSD